MGQGVLYVVAHLIITLAVIGGYIYSYYTGHPDEALKGSLFVIIGYWFGSVGDKMKNGGKNNE